MTRDEIVEELVGPGGNLPSQDQPPSSFFDPYLSDAYRLFSDDDTLRSFACIHKTLSLAHLQVALETATLLSNISPIGASPFIYQIWVPITYEEGSTFFKENPPVGILGVKETISTEDDWLEDITYDPTTGEIGGLPDDEETYWIPQVWFQNPYVLEVFLGNLGLYKEDLPPTLLPLHLPILLSLTERALQEGGTHRSILRILNAWSGGEFHILDQAEEDGDGKQYDPVEEEPPIEIIVRGRREREWTPPIRIGDWDTSKQTILLEESPTDEMTPLQEGRIILLPPPLQTRGEGYVTDGAIIRWIQGDTICLSRGVVTPEEGYWPFFQVLRDSPSPAKEIVFRFYGTFSEEEQERINRVINILIPILLTPSFTIEYEEV